MAFRGRSWGSVIGMLRVRLQPGPRFDRCYAISPEDGQLTPISSFSTPGRTARDFGIDETGPRLYAGNQQSDAIVQCDIDLGTVPEAGDVEWAVVAHAVCVNVGVPSTRLRSPLA